MVQILNVYLEWVFMTFINYLSNLKNSAYLWVCEFVTPPALPQTHIDVVDFENYEFVAYEQLSTDDKSSRKLIGIVT